MLPRSEKLEYVKREKTYPGGEFNKLKSFLLERKAEDEELRKFGLGRHEDDKPISRKLCDHCGLPGHVKKDCRRWKRETKSTEEDSVDKVADGACWNCGEKGHIQSKCLAPKRGRGQDRSNRNGSKAGQSVASNHLRTSDCPRCKNASSLPGSCAGCSKSGPGLKHCLAHCSSFVAENVTGKTSIVKKAGNCVICLHPNHSADPCYNKDNDKRVCGLDGCKSHHHPTLHGAKPKDPIVANCNLTEVTKICGTFSKWTDSYTDQKFVRCYKGKMSRKSEDDNDKLLANWQQERRDLELTELHRRLGDQLIDGDRVLLIIQEIRMLYGVSRKETTVISFNDPGSTCSLVLTDFAEKHELLGRPVTITIGTVNGEKQRETKLYMVELLTITGDRKLVSAFRMEHISGEVPYICFEGVKHLPVQSVNTR